MNFITLNTQQKRQRERGVITLIAVFAVGLLALGAALSAALGAATNISETRNATTGARLLYAGESAASEGVYQFLSASSYMSGAAQLINDADTGTMEVMALPWPYVGARGVVWDGTTRRTVTRIISRYPGGQAFLYAVYAVNDLTMSGNVTVNGNVFANGEIDFNGASAEVNGDAFSVVSVGDTDNISGLAQSGVDPVPPPSIAIDPYRDTAIANGTYFTATDDAKAYLNDQARTGVIVLDDLPELKLQNSTQLTGSLVTTHDLALTGGIYAATANYAAIVVYGDLKIAGGTTINGVVYVEGTTTFGSGNNTINGSLVSAGGVSTDVTGNSTINYDPTLATIWPDLTGLNTSTAEPPEVILWEES